MRVIAIRHPKRNLVSWLEGGKVKDVFIHPQALCESKQVGRGTRIWAFAHVLDDAIIGENCNICDHAFIEGGAKLGNGVIVKNRALIWDGVTIEDDVFIGPGATFTNDRYPRSRHLPEASERYTSAERWLVPTRVRRGASIGAGAVILCGVVIGEYSVVAAGALVTRDVPDFALVVRQPARQAGIVCRCGMPIQADHPCPQCSNYPSKNDTDRKVTMGRIASKPL